MNIDMQRVIGTGCIATPDTVQYKHVIDSLVIYFDSHMKEYKHERVGVAFKLIPNLPIIRYRLTVKREGLGLKFEWQDQKPSNFKEIEEQISLANKN